MNAVTSISRRKLLKGAAVATAAGALGPFFSGRVLGANDRVNLAIIGIRNQGAAHIKGFGALPNVRIKTFCDLDQNLYASRLKEFEAKFKYRPGTEPDLRRVFDDKEIDAVTLAVPNHWHALGAIWGMQAKKHVYVEKPACQSLWEGRQMINAAKKYGVVVQVGFQNRSRVTTQAAMKLLHDGKLGKIYLARGLCFKARGDIGRYPDGPMPEGSTYSMTVGGASVAMGMQTMPGYSKSYLEKVDYDRWLGPAAAKPFNPNRFHYNWHWFWDYGNGDTGNQGPHQFDVGRWGINKDEAPVRVRSFGGYYEYDSAQETPNTQTSIFEYADGTIFEFCTRGLLTNAEGGVKIGNIFYGTKGRLEIDADGAWRTFMGPKDEPGPDSKSIVEEKSDANVLAGSGSGRHYQNYIDAVRANDPKKVSCDIETGYRSSILPIMANISYRVKRELKVDGKKEQFVGDAEATRMLRRNDRKGYAVPSLG
jgi:predicted dehydrogenase